MVELTAMRMLLLQLICIFDVNHVTTFEMIYEQTHNCSTTLDLFDETTGYADYSNSIDRKLVF